MKKADLNTVIPASPGFYVYDIGETISGERLAIIAWHIQTHLEDIGSKNFVQPITVEGSVLGECGIENPDGTVVIPWGDEAIFPTVAAFHAAYPPWPKPEAAD